MEWDQALRTRLQAATGVTALVDAEKINWGERPQIARLPAITMDIIDDPRPQHMQGFQGLRPSYVQIDIWAKNPSSRASIREAVIAALVPAVTTDGHRFARAFVEGSTDETEQTETATVFRHRMDFKFNHASA